MGAEDRGRDGADDALARFLRERRDELRAAWEEELGRAGIGGDRALGERLPELLEELAEAARGRPGATVTRDHLRRDLARGVALGGVVAELAALRRAIERRWEPHRRPGDGIRAVAEEMDRLVGAAAASASGNRDRAFRALERIAALVPPRGDLGPSATALATTLREALPAVDEVTLLLREGDTLAVAAQVGLVLDHGPAPERIRVGEGFAGTIAATGRPLEVENPAEVPLVVRPAPKRSGLRGLYGVPLQRDGEVLGVAHMGSRGLPRFSDLDKLVFRAMVDRVAMLLAERDLRRAVAREHEAALEGRRQLQAILDVLPVGVFVADAFGRLLATNAAVRKVWGGAVPAGIGADRYAAFRAYRVDTGRLLAPEDWAIARALAGETVLDQELDIVRFDGHCGTILNSAAPIRDESDRLVGAVAINVDISERRRAARDRDFLAEVARALSESLDYDATLRRLVDLAVPRLAEWCAIDVLETEGLRRMAVADAVPERALAGAAAGGEAAGAGPASARVVETGEPLFLPEVTRENLRAALPGGDERIEVMLRAGVRSFLAVPLVARGRTLGAMLFALGSATRRFGRSDLALARELGVRAALAVDNARLYRDAREAIRARDDLWAVASHELRNPLAALLLLVQGSKRALQRGEPGVNERLDKAIHQIRRINALVGDLLDSTRAQSGRLEIRRERVDLAEVALEVVDRHRPEARIAGATLILEDRARPVGCWDPGRLDQVLTNLVGNALKYGGGARIEVVVDRTDGEALLTVADDGPGIAPEDQARIFEPFERVKDSGRKQGLGLGLFIVRRIVEGHGGRIELQSAPGAGARFTVRLPVGPCPGETDRPPAEEAVSAGTPPGT